MKISNYINQIQEKEEKIMSLNNQSKEKDLVLHEKEKEVTKYEIFINEYNSAKELFKKTKTENYNITKQVFFPIKTNRIVLIFVKLVRRK